MKGCCKNLLMLQNLHPEQIGETAWQTLAATSLATEAASCSTETMCLPWLCKQCYLDPYAVLSAKPWAKAALHHEQRHCLNAAEDRRIIAMAAGGSRRTLTAVQTRLRMGAKHAMKQLMAFLQQRRHKCEPCSAAAEGRY